ncbi:hypothetical protein IL306_010088 [Fusarium sp. DS 682]|nr:hypothetical protein IL306_010088 [Fusarium sp. DS 682]
MKQPDDSGPTATTTANGPQPLRPRSSVSAGQTPRRLPVNPRRHKVAPEHRKRVATAYGPPRPHSIQLSHPVTTPHNRQDDEENLVSTEGRLLHDPDGYARFLGETSGATFLDYLKEFMTTVLPLAYQNLRPGSDGSAFLSSLGRYQTYDSRPLHDRDVDPTWFPAPPEMDSMLSELRYFIQDGNCNWPSGGIYWWGNLSSAPTIPSMERDSANLRLAKCRHLAFYQTAFAVVSQAMIMPPQDISIDPHLSENYFSRARMLLGNPLDITHFTPNEVAVLTLMGFYLIEMNRRDAAYICVSNAMHISIMHAEHNIRLARQVLLVNHPRKLLQAGLHFIFNAAIVLMLQQLVEDLCPSSRSEKARSLDLDFVIGRFEDESRVGSNYGRDCATVLRDLRVLVQRLPIPVDLSTATRSVNMTQTTTTYDPIANRTTVDMGQQWSDKLTSEALQQPILVDQGHILYNELVSWIDVDWQSYNGYLI